jgi:hypothetical protein
MPDRADLGSHERHRFGDSQLVEPGFFYTNIWE